jgi:putative ABC transport system permease protein
MKILRQTYAVLELNIRNLRERLTASAVCIASIAAVVAVLIAVLAMSAGMMKMARASGRADRAIVLRSGAATELTSRLDRDAVATILDAPGIKRDAAGAPIASAETLALIQLTKRDGTDASVPMRGVDRHAMQLRPEIRVVEGRLFRAGVNEVIVGRRAHDEYANLGVGDQVRTQGAVWTVAGIFESNGDAHESELMTNNDTLAGAMRRISDVQAVTVLLESPAALEPFQRALASHAALSVDAVPEPAYFAQQSGGVAGLLSMLAYAVGAIMAVGAVAGALNTMYSAVSTRATEIAVLRAVGFGGTTVVVSVLVEALLLALTGAILGAAVVWLLLDGQTISTAAGSTVAMSRAFSLDVSSTLALTGIKWAVIIGLIGGLFPAIRAARLPVAAALSGE